MILDPRPPEGDDRPPGSRGNAPAEVEPVVHPLVPVAFPADVLRGTSGGPAAVVVRTTRGWAVLRADGPASALAGGVDGLTLVEAMSLADLVTSELGAVPEPDRAARRAARSGRAPGSAPGPDEAPDARDDEIAALRRTVGQLEHALAARVSVERALGVLAERHGLSPREAFEQLRGHARSQGRPATELAGEVLDGLPLGSPALGQRGEPAGGRATAARPDQPGVGGTGPEDPAAGGAASGAPR